MTDPVRILGFAGALRRDSFNKKLVRVALAGAAEAGAETSYLDLTDYRMPVYDGDDEVRDGLPEAARALKREVIAHHALLISSPEYNGSVTAVLKNTLDWISRREDGEDALAAYDGKVAGLLAASPGGLGGLRGLAHLRQILSGIRVLVIPQQYALARAGDSFDPDGNLIDAAQDEAARAIGRKVAETTAKLRS